MSLDVEQELNALKEQLARVLQQTSKLENRVSSVEDMDANLQPPVKFDEIPYGGAIWWWGDSSNPPPGWEVVGHPDNDSPRVEGLTIASIDYEGADIGDNSRIDLITLGAVDDFGGNIIYNTRREVMPVVTPGTGVWVTESATWGNEYWGPDAGGTTPIRSYGRNPTMAWVLIWKRPPYYDAADPVNSVLGNYLELGGA